MAAAATAAVPLDEAKAKEVLRQVRGSYPVPGSCPFWPLKLWGNFSDRSRLAFFCSAPQVEFYFSDSNLPRDKFLRETVEQREDGCK